MFGNKNAEISTSDMFRQVMKEACTSHIRREEERIASVRAILQGTNESAPVIAAAPAENDWNFPVATGMQVKPIHLKLKGRRNFLMY